MCIRDRIKIGQDMENVLLGLDFILFAQTIALMKSLSLGITPVSYTHLGLILTLNRDGDGFALLDAKSHDCHQLAHITGLAIFFRCV